jgi:SM-20-related protein
MLAGGGQAPLVADIVARGWSVRPDWLAAPLVATLAAEARALRAAGAFRAAGVGSDRRRARQVRGDEILWLEHAPASAAQRAALDALEALRLELNRECLLGLFELEAHLAAYPPGAGYRTHLDRLRDDDARVLSIVLYLNADWQVEDGGALRLYLEAAGRAPHADVAPVGGTLVAFLSGEFPHEVLPARRERLSLTGWFRRRALRAQA